VAGITFRGKSAVQNHHLSVPFHELVPCPSQSVTDELSLDDNLIIHGDNLIALKALLPTHAGRVDLCFIDPPYNTGEEGWVYNDNVSSPLVRDWLNKEVGKDDLTRHDKWLCLMMPRLALIRELLTDDGAVFIAIDDNEYHRLRMLMDEVFGEDNFVATLVWQARKSVQNDTDISQSHNYVLAYAKNRRQTERRLKKANAGYWFSMAGFVFLPIAIDADKYSNPDNDTRGPWKADPFDAPGVRANLSYEIVNPNTHRAYLPPNGRHWRMEESKYLAALADSRVLFGTRGTSKPQLKVFLNEQEEFGSIDTTWWGEGAFSYYVDALGDVEEAEELTDYGTTTDGSKLLQAMFGGDKVFPNPKPIQLVMRILEQASHADAIILDSFAGSGTTGHAVLQLNSIDQGNRRFILIECEEYADSLTAERIRKAIAGIPDSSSPYLAGTGGSFTYMELGDALTIARLLEGEALPTFGDLARYVFFTATGRDLDPAVVDSATGYVGETEQYRVYLMYEPDREWLKSAALTLERARALGESGGKTRLVYAPSRFLDADQLADLNIQYCQLPFDIFRLRG